MVTITSKIFYYKVSPPLAMRTQIATLLTLYTGLMVMEWPNSYESKSPRNCLFHDFKGKNLSIKGEVISSFCLL